MATQEIWDSIDVAEVTRLVKANLTQDAAPGLGVFAEFARDLGIEDQDDFDPRSAGLMSEFNDFLDEKVSEVVSEEISRLTFDVTGDGGALAIYRSIVVPNEWNAHDLSARSLGVCWSWEAQFAVPYSGGGDEECDKEVRLTGTVDVDGVDWELTVALNATNAYWGEDEREIRLHDDAEVSVGRIESRPYSTGTFEAVADLNGEKYRAGELMAPSMAM
jgi:hypothetical protein